MQHPKKVLIGSGPRLFREFLSTMLQAREEFEVIDKLYDGMAITQSATLHRPDLLILDLFLPRFNGVSVVNSLRSKCPRMKIIMLTDYESEGHVSEAFQAGAHGYCTKNTRTEELLEAIQKVMAGKNFISSTVAAGLLEGYLDGPKGNQRCNDWDLVTKREREVLKLLAEGYKNKETGKILCISCKTVEKHRSNIMNKLGLRTVADLTRYAHVHGLIKNGQSRRQESGAKNYFAAGRGR